jgi:beta-galactosidase
MLVYMRNPQNRIDSDISYVSAAVRQLRPKLSPMKHLVWHLLKADRVPAAIVMILLLAATLGSSRVHAQQTEPSLPLSQRFTINLASGVPEYVGNAASASNSPQSQWWFENTNNSAQYSNPAFVESTDSSGNWQQVGLPYDANIPRTFINQTSGGGQGSLTGNENWYRLHFKVDPTYAGQKFLLDLEGSHTGVQVFINGTLLPGISAVAADAQATHVVGFIPVVVDLTQYLHTDGVTDNVIAVDVSRGDPWFEQPGFSGAFRFGQAMAGLFRNVYLYVTNPVHIPINVYSNQKTWGTYVGTVSEVPAAQGTATAASAVVEVQTNVLNETGTTQQVTLTTQIVDASGNVVVTAPPITQSVHAMTMPGSFPATSAPMFQQLITVPNPTLWYPNNSIYGTPYMYTVYHIVSVNGVVVDSAQSPLGIRTITWDANFPYFNGHAHYLWGGAGRYDYPALGSSVPDEQDWRDLAQIAAQGGNVWRPGHSTSSEEFVEAADAYGIMIDQPSGDGEGYFNNPTADDTTLKEELHRDMIIRDRSHPSILDWEEDNGGNNPSLANALASIETLWDNINPRMQADRTYLPAYAYIDECDAAGCEVGNKQQFPNNPAFGAEYWDNVGTGRGLAYDYELAFAAPYLNDWSNGRAANAFGMAQWYFADSPGEVSLYAEYQNQPNMINFVRSLGYSSVDMNRFPRLLYYIYQANWVPYSIKPVVHLAHHWNRAYEYTPGTPIQENAFSNCPAVRLLINGVAKDPVTGAVLADQTPNPWNVNSGTNLTQNTTVMPGQVSWMVNWAPGTVTAECLDSNDNVVPGVTDARTTAGPENKIVLSVVPEVTKPDGTSFQWTSNGSDAAFVTAEVEDAQGNLVPTAADNVTFNVSGPATYMGGSEQLVADPSWTNYYQDAFSQANSTVIQGVPYAFFHAPGDPELNFEGGLTKIALRSTFSPGTVTVTATAPGLASGSVQLTSVLPPAPPQSQPQLPVIIVPPADTSVTAGFPATFTVAASGSGTLSYQWSVNGSQVAGATGTTYKTPATTLAQNGESVSVTISSTSGLGPVISNPVTLTVSTPATVAITTQPASQVAVVGQSATLTVVATGSPQLNYAWYNNGAQVQSGSQNTYTTPVLAAAGTQSFYVIVSNPLGQVQSNTAVLTVGAPIPVSITTSPVGEIVAVNQPVQFTAVVAGSAPYTYQWQFTLAGGSPIILVSNTQTSNIISFTIPAMSSANVGAYTVTVNNAANAPVTSAPPAQLTLAPPGVNLALGMPATSSSSQNACTDGTTSPPFSGAGCLGAENAVDGNLGTRWGSATAGAPPTPPVAGVDPSWLQVDLGSVQAFNTVIINWENAYATQYQIQYTSADPSTNPTWNTAIINNAGVGGTETLNFPTVQGRYIRMYGKQRATQYGYSIFEFQVYNVSQCGGASERYTVNTANPSLLFDNLLGLTWTRTVQTDTAPGSQFTGVNAAAYCSSLQMRIPTESEALSISGDNNASCAFPGAWSTWTSTVDPNDASETAIVNFDGTSTWNVTNNFPGQTLCDAGVSAGQPPIIQTPPQPITVGVGQAATFTVAASGVPAPTYQWLENGAPIAGATSATYFTQPTALTDNGELFSVSVSNGSGTLTSSAGLLTVTNTTPPPVNPAPPVNTGAGNTNSTDTAIPGFGTGPTPAGPNLAIGKVPTSSGDEGGFPVNQAIDGDLTTRWSSTFVDPSWIQIDLGSVQPIGQVVLRWERAYGTQYQIQVSTDAQNWTPAFKQMNGQGGSENLVFPTVSGRYIRMYGTQRSTQYGYSLWEFEVYGPVGPTIQTEPVSQTVVAGSQAQFTVVAAGTGPFTYQWLLNGAAISGATSATYTTSELSSFNSGSLFSVAVSNAGGSVTSTSANLTVTSPTPGIANLALGKSATSSGNENAGLGPLNAVDGDLTTRWSSAFVNPSWIEVDLGSPLLIDKVVLYWQAAYGTQYQIQVSNDEQTWTPVYTQTAGQGGVETLMFPAVIDRYIRMYGTARATQYGYSLFEFQVFGADVPIVVTPPASQAVTAGATATFNVVAGGDGPFAYQWLRNGVAIPGATATSYTTPALMSGDSGSVFTVNVTNAGGTTTSPQAVLTVNSNTPTGPNLALNQPATESAGQNDATFGPAFAVDGNLTTRWSSAFVDPSWITVDLGTAQTINQVMLYWEAAYATQYQIQVSNDAQNWTKVFTQSAGQGGVENITFVPVSARYVRMYGTVRATQYGYSLYEFQIYGPSTAPTIAAEPANQSANVGSTATFTVTAGGTGPFTYQWLKNGVAITGATAASYTTPALLSTDNGDLFSVAIGSTSGTVTSMAATLSVGNYTIYPGFVGVDLNNNTNGAWANNQIYVTVIGIDPSNNQFAYLTPGGTIVDFTLNDASASNHVTGPNGQSYGNYSFTLAQSTLLKIPTFISARAYISLGAPLYVQVNGDGNGNVTGYAGPNPQNATDPNINTHFDWYEFNNQNGIFINTTQVDEFGLPLLLDVWGAGGTFHKEVGITESIAQIDSEFSSQVPAQFQPPAMSNLRILSPSKLSMAPGGANANYFDNYTANAWTSYSTTPVAITLNGRQFAGTSSGSTLTFTEVNPAAANAGETFVVQQPSTQDILECAGTMATGVPGSTPQLQDENAVQLQLENQICSATNRGVLPTPANWASVPAYYNSAPANFYSQFWHNHSIGGLAYGFSYDDNNNQSTTITTPQPEHMSFGIGW